jgi:hypothetical protein
VGAPAGEGTGTAGTEACSWDTVPVLAWEAILAGASPEDPDAAGAGLTSKPAEADPRTAELVAVEVEVSDPVASVEPDSPEVTTGSLSATDVASPVSPVLVEAELALALPDVPELAVGPATTVELPPAPPLLCPEPVLEPPAPAAPVWARAGAARRSSAASTANAAAALARARPGTKQESRTAPL